MTPIKFPEGNTIYAKDQDEYLPLPAHMNLKESIATFCWSLSFLERVKVLFTGKIWHQVKTFDEPLQPQRLQVDCPFERKKKFISGTGFGIGIFRGTGRTGFGF